MCQKDALRFPPQALVVCPERVLLLVQAPMHPIAGCVKTTDGVCAPQRHAVHANVARQQQPQPHCSSPQPVVFGSCVPQADTLAQGMVTSFSQAVPCIGTAPAELYLRSWLCG